MVVVKFIIPSDKTDSGVEIIRWTITNYKQFDIKNFKNKLSQYYNQTEDKLLLTWFDGKDECSLINNNDLNELLKYAVEHHWHDNEVRINVRILNSHRGLDHAHERLDDDSTFTQPDTAANLQDGYEIVESKGPKLEAIPEVLYEYDATDQEENQKSVQQCPTQEIEIEHDDDHDEEEEDEITTPTIEGRLTEGETVLKHVTEDNQVTDDRPDLIDYEPVKVWPNEPSSPDSQEHETQTQPTLDLNDPDMGEQDLVLELVTKIRSMGFDQTDWTIVLSIVKNEGNMNKILDELTQNQ